MNLKREVKRLLAEIVNAVRSNYVRWRSTSAVRARSVPCGKYLAVLTDGVRGGGQNDSFFYLESCPQLEMSSG